MPEPIKSDFPTSDQKWFRAEGEFHAFKNLPGSILAEGSGIGASGNICIGGYDGYYCYGLDFTKMDLSEDRADGTTQDRESNVLSIHSGRTERYGISLDGGSRTGAFIVGSEKGLGYVIDEMGGGDTYIGGENVARDEGLWSSIVTQTKKFGGYEGKLDGRTHFNIKGGVIIGIFTPTEWMNGDPEYFYSPYNISFFVSAGLVFADDSQDPFQDAPLTIFDIFNEFSGDAISYLQHQIAFTVSQRTSGGFKLLEDNEYGGGEDSQQTEDIRFFRTFNFLFGAGPSNEVWFYDKALKAGSPAASLKIWERVIGSGVETFMGFSGGKGGEDLAGHGIEGWNAVFGMLLLYTELSKKQQAAVRIFTAQAQQVIGAWLDIDPLRFGAGSSAVSFTTSPDPTKSQMVPADIEVTISPYTWFYGEAEGHRSSVRSKHTIPIDKDTNMITGVEIAGDFDAEKRIDEAGSDTGEPRDINIPISVRPEIGLERPVELSRDVKFEPSVAFHTTQEFGNGNQTGLGGSANLFLSVELSDNVRAGGGIRAVAEVFPDSHTNVEVAPAFSFSGKF